MWSSEKIYHIKHANSVILSTDIANQGVSLPMTNTKPYVLGVSLSSEGNAKLLLQLIGFNINQK